MSHRLPQINSFLLAEVSQFLVRNLELTDALVTVTRVEATPDLKFAKAFISVLPENRRLSALKAVRKITGQLNREIFRSAAFEPVPKINFFIDEIETSAQTIEKILDSLPHE